MTVVHFSGSWHDQPGCKPLKEAIEARGFRIACDWLSPKHQDRPKWPEQYAAILEAVKQADLVFLSFDGMEARDSSATFAQFHMAMALDKQIIVYDPDKRTRSNRDRQGNPVHRNMNHLMGKAMVHSRTVLWVDDRTTALEAIADHATFKVKVGPDAVAAAI